MASPNKRRRIQAERLAAEKAKQETAQRAQTAADLVEQAMRKTVAVETQETDTTAKTRKPKRTRLFTSKKKTTTKSDNKY